MSNENSSRDSLGDRMRSYEALSTTRQLMPNCPIYARIDGRAFHTFCRGLKKPYSKAFIEVMQETCKYLVKETTAILGYVQSDEISLGWIDSQHCPFDGRVQKLESVLASMASAIFVKYIAVDTPKFYGPLRSDYKTEEEFAKGREEYAKIATDNMTMEVKIDKNPPCFDCRVFNVPTLEELANSFLWRENDAIKNSISGMALNFYSHNELQNKNSDEKIHMMRMKGYCFWEDTDPAFMRGTFFRRENYLKELSSEEVERIPLDQRENLIFYKDGATIFAPGTKPITAKAKTYYCWRSHIVPMNLPYRLSETTVLQNVLFGDWNTVNCKIENPTFDLSKREVSNA